MDDNAFERRRGVRHLGQYKPSRPYPLTDGLQLIPAGWDMFSYGSARVRLNISYLVGSEILSDTELAEKYRNWLVFDAFALDDQFSIYCYDENSAGGIDTVPSDLIRFDEQNPDYKQVDYSNIQRYFLRTELVQTSESILSYRDLYAVYQTLDPKLRDLIEWYVSKPFRSHLRLGAFFNPNYWQLLHVTILLERLIDSPPACTHSFGKCPSCGVESQAHPSIRRSEWLRMALDSQIGVAEIVEEYARVIEKCISVRNKIAHTPTFDSSAFPNVAPGETHTYTSERAIAEYLHDSFALQSLLVSATYIGRYLLADKAFGTKHFAKLLPMKATGVGSS
ncbi:hypothetical protein P3T40_002014 [Paraburkholderia sp. EB58]|uniref:hypothetical protein n=1 Tax=Paraburkholderia sp. EB58 TaxID=3035125 RepID=UPI003D22B1E8